MKILAHGDSWFSYPKILLTGGSVIDHLSDRLELPIKNMAHAGDGTETMLGLRKREELICNLPDYDVLLFSGGGNDIAGDQFILWVEDNKGTGIDAAINRLALRHKLDSIEDNYRDLIQIRDETNPNCLLVTHGYDFPIPSDQGVCGLGPWLKPGLVHCGWTDPIDQFEIVKWVMQEFDARLTSIEAEQKRLGKRHVHVRTQGTLGASDWANEIHANRQGLDKLAAKFEIALAAY